MARSTRSAHSSALSQSHSTFRIKPLAAAVSFALISAQVAYAQDQATQENALEEVTVTGSRIQAAVGMTTPTPVSALSADDLKIMSGSSVTEALVQLPQFFNSQTAENFGSGSNSFFSSPGGGGVNLRGIGSSRTLILLNGRRVPSASIFGGPDVSTFPDSMLKRVETVTGGASAAYGTDAVSGVVNYILDTKFEGVRVSGQFGRTFRSDGDNSKYQFSVGHALTDQLHVLFSASYSNQDAINQTGGRGWYNSCGLIQSPNFATNPLPSQTSASNPRYIEQCNLRSTQVSMDGVLNPAGTGPLGRITFDSRGNPMPFANGSLISGDGQTQVGGSGEDAASYLNVLLPAQTSKNLFGYLNFDISDDTSIFVQGIHNEQTLDRTTLVGTYSTTLAAQNFTIYPDNAFLPSSISSAMTANNIASLTFNRQLTPGEGAVGHYINDSKLNVLTTGFKTKLSSTWNMDGYLQYGRTDQDLIQRGYTRQDRVFLAADAVRDSAGTIRCRVNTASGANSAYTARVPDCVPLNLFGRGAPSAGAIDWISGLDPGVPVTTIPYINSAQSYASEAYKYLGDADKHRLVELQHRFVELIANGEVLDGWAGPISAAIGANYRKESVEQRVRASQGNTAADPTYFPVWCNDGATTGNCGIQIAKGIRPAGNINVRGVPGGVQTNIVETQFSNVPNLDGNYNVKEAFTELVVPLIADLAWMKNMNFQGAYRFSKYTGSGNISSWKAGLDMAFTDQIRLRGTFSHDTRAGNIADRFDRTGGLSPNFTDKKPQVPGQPTVPTATYAATIVSGGNPLIQPETGDTFTLGVVYQPSWVSGLDVSVDWMRLNLKNAIESLSVQQMIDQCYVSNDQAQCSRITRGIDGITGNDIIVFVNQSRQNLGKATYNGVDFELGYTTPIEILGGGERITARVIGTFLIEESTTNFFGVKTDNTESLALQFFKRKINAVLGYRRGDFNFNLSGRYNSGGIKDKTWNLPTLENGALVQKWDVQDRDVGGSIYWDTRLSYRFALGDADLEIFGNVQNLFDKPPAFATQVGVGLQTYSAYDQIGRRFVIGANVKF